MELQRITKQQAIRLQKLGLNIKLDNDFRSEIPTIDLVCKWFRDKHKISVETGCNASGWYSGIGKVDGTTITALFDEGPNSGGCWDSYESAQSDAIDWLLANEELWLTKKVEE